MTKCSWNCPTCGANGEIEHVEDVRIEYLFRSVTEEHESKSPGCRNRHIPVKTDVLLFDPERGYSVRHNN